MFSSGTETIIIWLMIFISVAIIGGITYFVSKNKRTTITAILAATYFIAIFIISGFVNKIFTHQFIARYDALGVPYEFTKPGWSQITRGWSIWILPVLISGGLIMIITALIIRTRKSVPITSSTEQPEMHQPLTSFTQMTERLGKDSFKNTVTDSMEKLAEALVSITAQEHKIAELTEQLQKNAAHVDEDQQELEEQLSLLQLQLNAATTENQQLSDRLESCKTELELSHEMFNKLLEYKQNEGES